MSGLGAIISSASSAELLDASLALSKIDPVRELGLDLEIAQYNTRLEALTDPKAYAAKRETAFTEMIGHVRKSYDDAYRGFLSAGMGTDMAKGFALQAANNERITRRQVIEVRFPTNANLIGDMATIRGAAGSVMNLEGGQGRAAPARRRAASRKKRAPARRRR
jgi:hypothetical protein